MKLKTLVKKLDKKEADPIEICKALDYDPADWAQVWVAARLYWENGGQRFSPGEFISLINPPTPPEVKDAWVEMMTWDPREWEEEWEE